MNYDLVGEYLEEPIASGVVDPRIVIGTSDTSVQMQGFAWQLFGCQFAAASRNTCLTGFRCALLPPWLKGFGLINISWILNPLNDLCHCYKVDIIVGFKNLIDPGKEGIKELRVVL